MKTNKTNCQFVKTKNHWACLLSLAVKSDASKIAYLKEKLDSASAIVQRREAMGIYEQ